MFDDQPTTGGATPPPNLPVEPEDIFADVEPTPAAPEAPAAPKALSAGMLKPKAGVSASVMPAAEPMPEFPSANYDTKSPVIGKVIIGIASLAVLGGMGFGGWWLYGKFFATTNTVVVTDTVNNVPSTPTTPTTPVTPVTTVVEEPTPTTPSETTDTTSTVAQMQNDQLLFGERQDTDNDGLDDAAETSINTNIKVSDTDSDNLCDGDEVLIWKTDPLKVDTDADKHADGTEVFNGYNPIGPGKLGPMPSGVSTSTLCQSSKK